MGEVATAMMNAGREAIGAGVPEFEVAIATSQAGTRKAVLSCVDGSVYARFFSTDVDHYEERSCVRPVWNSPLKVAHPLGYVYPYQRRTKNGWQTRETRRHCAEASPS